MQHRLTMTAWKASSRERVEGCAKAFSTAIATPISAKVATLAETAAAEVAVAGGRSSKCDISCRHA